MREGLLMTDRVLRDFGSGFGWVGVPACLIFLHEECACIIKYGKCVGGKLAGGPEA